MTETHTQHTAPPESAGLSGSIERRLRAYFEALGDDRPSAGLYERVVREVEVPLITIALEECGGNQLRAAALLGLNRNTLRKKIKELGLGSPKTLRRRKRGAS
ncbi:MAG: hypothetical protein EOM37_07125 [Proteobacteria bacterium]|jgi:two-component system nitrogen regulation response regulator GlnG|nr:helix-turn-helix domain-containing protein [Alphaproteobacteria bacterium]NCC03801.1 hypothetical protein [Pseudomonadota bacterium]